MCLLAYDMFTLLRFSSVVLVLTISSLMSTNSCLSKFAESSATNTDSKRSWNFRDKTLLGFTFLTTRYNDRNVLTQTC